MADEPFETATRIEHMRGYIALAEGERVSVPVASLQAFIEDLEVARGLNAKLGARVIAYGLLADAATEFQRLTQERINSSFAEAAYDPTDWRRAERDLLSALSKAGA